MIQNDDTHSITDPTTYPERPERAWPEGHEQREIAESNGELITALLAYRDAIVEDLQAGIQRFDLPRIGTVHAYLQFIGALWRDAERRAAEREGQR